MALRWLAEAIGFAFLLCFTVSALGVFVSWLFG